jgi:acylphosphatase
MCAETPLAIKNPVAEGWGCHCTGGPFSACMSGVYHATVYFGGRVQGVGFRYQTFQVAREFEVAGWVMNLGDGRVQLEAEGKQEEVQAFIAALQERMEGHIRKTEQIAETRAPQFSGFIIR